MYETKKLTLNIFEGRFSILRLEKDFEVPAWVYESSFFSITRTYEELSIVCQESNIPANVPANIRAERDWSCLKVEGLLDFGLTGILAGISRVLAENKVSIFAVSTYDTDYILVKERDLELSVRVLKDKGYEFKSP
ncbi:ACT domain-containing protein [Methanosarcina horonobensis]|uniref:ACT domain-containing protein n=1 Tax=Methanosarcina horonobensis TaxID=418008 RepID=UPI00064F73A2